MKLCILTIMLAIMLAPTALLSQELQDGPQYQMQLPKRQLELQQRQAEMQMQQQKHALELEKAKLEIEHAKRAHKHKPCPILLVILLVHILTAVWVYQDIQRRSHQSGLWVVIALLAGLLGALVYAVVRLGDIPKEGTEQEKT